MEKPEVVSMVLFVGTFLVIFLVGKVGFLSPKGIKKGSL